MRGLSNSSRRDFIRLTGGAAILSTLGMGRSEAMPFDFAGNELAVPLTDNTNIAINGPHRYLTIAGLKGFQPTSLKTKAIVKTNIHHSPKGSVSFWFSPTEDMGFYEAKISNFPAFPLISDTFPPNDLNAMTFGIYWSNSYPQFMGKFTSGPVWAKLDHGLAPFVYAEQLTLRSGNWYAVVLTWDRPGNKLQLYVNGKLMGFYNEAGNFDNGREELYIGNPAMTIRDLVISDGILQEQEIVSNYTSKRPADNEAADEDIRKAVVIIDRPPLEIERDTSWKAAYSCTFKNKEDLKPWIFQTGDLYRDLFDVRITDDGLLIKTPQKIGLDSRMYLWSPQSFQGDQWIEFDFLLESPAGLALLAICTRGDLGEDYFDDHGVEKTGSMDFILNKTLNYHWEYMRRVEMMRTDVETQYLSKNPWHWRMHYSCFPRLVQNRWYRLRLLRMGDRLHGSIDGKTVFDVKDDLRANNGPVLNFGRIGLRQMYNTTMRYKNFSVYLKA